MAEKLTSISKTMFSGTKTIVTVKSMIICDPKKTVSLTNLILNAAQMIESNSSRIADEPEMIVYMKGKTTGAERMLL